MKIITQKSPEIKQDADEIAIPDLWHIAIRLPSLEQKMVLDTWHLCHSLLEHIRNQ